MCNNCNCGWPGLLNLFGRSCNNGCGCNGNGRSGNNGCGCGCGNNRSGNNGCGCNGNGRNGNGRNGNNCWSCQGLIGNRNVTNYGCYDAYFAAQYALNNNSCGCNSCNSCNSCSNFNSLTENGFGFLTISGGTGSCGCNSCNSCNYCGCSSNNNWNY